jgi:PASTA domain
MLARSARLEEPRERDLLPWLLVLLILVCAGLVGALLAVRANGHDRRARFAPVRTVAPAPQAAEHRSAPASPGPITAVAVTVPDVRGEKIAQACKEVRDAGLEPAEESVASTLRKHTVVAQVPAPGTSTRRGADVVLAVSAGTKEHGGPAGDDEGRPPGHGHGHSRVRNQ